MANEHLDLSGAATHFLRTEGPRGFLLKFALVYAVMALIMQVIGIWTQAPVYEVYIRAFSENDGDILPYMDEINAASARANLGSLILLPLGLGIWVLFDAASQRRYIRAEGFRLAIGADEGRIAVVGMIWLALLIAAYIGLILAAVIPGLIVGLVAGPVAGVIVGGMVAVAGLVAAIWLYARLSPASALTIRDQQIRFFEAWSLTKGNGWRLAGSYFLLFLAYLLITLIVYAVIFATGFALLSPTLGPGTEAGRADAIIAAMSQPAFWAPMSVLFFLTLMMSSVFTHAMGGPAALAVRQRTLEGGTILTETFA